MNISILAGNHDCITIPSSRKGC